MKTRFALASIVLAAFAAAADAQVLSVYASGFLHEPRGAATLGPLTDRRLPVSNLGSSGQDGVEVRLDSAWGTDLSVDLAPMLGPSTATRELRIRPKGWDGTIKGNIRTTSTIDGIITQQCNWTTSGATSFVWRCVDMNGGVLATGEVAGSIVSWGIVPDPVPGSTPFFHAINTKGTGANNGRSIRVQFAGEPDNICCRVSGLAPMPVEHVQAVEIDVVGANDDGRTSSCLVTSVGLSSFTLMGAALQSLGVPCPPWDCIALHDNQSMWGLGQAQVLEQCPPGGDCDDDDSRDRYLSVSNIGSSGQDGVSIDLGPTSNGGGLALSRERCCYGHVTLIKLFDDLGNEVSRLGQSSNPATGTQQISCDASASGATEIEIILYDQNFGEITRRLTAMPAASVTVMIMSADAHAAWTTVPACAGTYEECATYASNRVMNVQLPSGEAFPAFAVSMHRVLSGVPAPHIRRLEFTGNAATGGLYVDEVRPPQCVSDVDDGTGTGTPDGGVTIEDLLYYLQRFDAGC